MCHCVLVCACACAHVTCRVQACVCIPHLCARGRMSANRHARACVQFPLQRVTSTCVLSRDLHVNGHRWTFRDIEGNGKQQQTTRAIARGSGRGGRGARRGDPGQARPGRGGPFGRTAATGGAHGPDGAPAARAPGRALPGPDGQPGLVFVCVWFVV